MTTKDHPTREELIEALQQRESQLRDCLDHYRNGCYERLLRDAEYEVVAGGDTPTESRLITQIGQLADALRAIASGRAVTVPVDVLRELADLRAEYARVRRVAQQIADGSGCANCRGIAIEFDATVDKEP